VTLGITPERPDTGFGYIEAADKLDIEAPVEVRAVKRFVEKPKREAAERMVAAGGHYWNAGMFVWRVEEILRAYEKHLPKTAAAIAALRDAIGTPRYESVLAEVWEETDRTTLDYGIAEKADNVAVVPADIGWQDVGSWARLAEIVSKADNWASGDLVAEDSRSNYVWAPQKTVAPDHHQRGLRRCENNRRPPEKGRPGGLALARTPAGTAEGRRAVATRLGAPAPREPAEASEAGRTPARREGFGGGSGLGRAPVFPNVLALFRRLATPVCLSAGGRRR